MIEGFPTGLPGAGLSPHVLGERLLALAAATGGALGVEPRPASGHPHDIARFAAPLFCEARAGRPGVCQAVEASLKGLVLSALGLAGQGACTLTGSGSESLLLAVLAAKRARTGRIAGRPRVIAARNVHPAVAKAAALLDVELILTDCAAGDVADPEAFARAIDSRTILLVASAPGWASGACDPVAKIADLALARGVPCHVDACIGGMLYPFLDPLEGEARARALGHPGVASLSVDLHKFGYAPPTLSALCFASPVLAATTRFATADWDGFAYASDSIAGDRPFGPIAAAWSILQGLGHAGYEAYARRLLDRRAALLAVLWADDLHLARPPQSGVLCLQSRTLDGAALSRRLNELGVATIFCERPGFVRLRIDPLISDEAFQTLRAGLGRAAEALG
jgi:sphinganine-1-phosphate aldolase